MFEFHTKESGEKRCFIVVEFTVYTGQVLGTQIDSKNVPGDGCNQGVVKMFL